MDLCCNEWLELDQKSLVLINRTFQVQPPSNVGFRFSPTDEELIIWYLWRKVNNLPLPNNLVVDLNIYETDPSCIQFDDDIRFIQGERYFFVERETISRNVNGKRPRRTMTTQNAVGYWHANTGDKTIKNENNNVIGYRKSLTFFRYEDINKKDRKKAKKCDWIMHEYKLTTNKFEKWVLCRIKKSRPKKDEFEI